jgi:hypothetical protein
LEEKLLKKHLTSIYRRTALNVSTKQEQSKNNIKLKMKPVS